MACDIKGCTCQDAPWSPILLLYAPARYGEHPPIQSQLSLKICDTHKESLKPEDLICDAGWIQIEQAVASRGKAKPDRSRTRIDWTRWEGSMMQRLKSAQDN